MSIITFSIRSDTSNSVMLPPSWHSLREISLMIGLRGVADGVDRVAEADHDLLALHACANVGFRLVGAAVARDDVHRHFVGAAVLGPAQRDVSAGGARVHVRTGAGDPAPGDRACIAIVFSERHLRPVTRTPTVRSCCWGMLCS